MIKGCVWLSNSMRKFQLYVQKTVHGVLEYFLYYLFPSQFNLEIAGFSDFHVKP
jgi:hypothetical protein